MNYDLATYNKVHHFEYNLGDATVRPVPYSRPGDGKKYLPTRLTFSLHESRTGDLTARNHTISGTKLKRDGTLSRFPCVETFYQSDDLPEFIIDAVDAAKRTAK